MVGSLPGESSHHGSSESGPARGSLDRQGWYFTWKEIEESSPSRRDGIDLKKETYLRKSYCTYLQDLGMRLKVPQVTIATAVIFCHRFFIRQSHAKNDRRSHAFGQALGRFAEAKILELQRKDEEIESLKEEVQGLNLDKVRLQKDVDLVPRLRKEKEDLQANTLEELKKAANEAEVREKKLNSIHDLMLQERAEAAAALKAKAEELDAHKKVIQDLEAQADEIAKASHLRDEKIQALEAKVDEQAQDAEASLGEKEKLEQTAERIRRRIGKYQKALKYNERTIDHWRPQIYQSGYDLCRKKIQEGTSVDDLEKEVAPPPGWWGDERPCLEGLDFTDWPSEEEAN